MININKGDWFFCHSPIRQLIHLGVYNSGTYLLKRVVSSSSSPFNSKKRHLGNSCCPYVEVSFSGFGSVYSVV
jgi:hypothetical protein